jgi:hypothetical protein
MAAACAWRVSGSIPRWRAPHACCSPALSPAVPLRNPSADPLGGAGVAPRDCDGVRASFAPYPRPPARRTAPVARRRRGPGGMRALRTGSGGSSANYAARSVLSAAGQCVQRCTRARSRALEEWDWRQVIADRASSLLPGRLRPVPRFGIAFVGGARSRGVHVTEGFRGGGSAAPHGQHNAHVCLWRCFTQEHG